MKDYICPSCGKWLPGNNPAFCPYCGHPLTNNQKAQNNPPKPQSPNPGPRPNPNPGPRPNPSPNPQPKAPNPGPVPPDPNPQPQNNPGPQNGSTVGSYFNDYVGNTGNSNLNWKVLFTDIFKPHKTSECEKIFISGTTETTPDPMNVSNDWPRPWLYFRVFLTFLAAYILLFLGCSLFGNTNLLPGLIIVGAMLVPISSVMLFVEMNVFRNVSMYKVALIFLVGGCASLFFTLILFEFFPFESLDFIGALITGIVEEIGKAAIIYIFLKRLAADKVLVGLLIGATIGAGFAAFETAGYALNILMAYGWDQMMDTIFLRNILTPGGHIAWGAISGAAIVLACKNGYSVSNLFSTRFLKLFIVPVVLHFIWDSPIANIGSEFYLMYLILIAVVWAFLLALINLGLSEVPTSNQNQTQNQP